MVRPPDERTSHPITHHLKHSDTEAIQGRKERCVPSPARFSRHQAPRQSINLSISFISKSPLIFSPQPRHSMILHCTNPKTREQDGLFRIIFLDTEELVVNLAGFCRACSVSSIGKRITIWSQSRKEQPGQAFISLMGTMAFQGSFHAIIRMKANTT